MTAIHKHEIIFGAACSIIDRYEDRQKTRAEEKMD
jgi:hypothetical protein